MQQGFPDPAAPLRFVKMHGLGNDFVVIDARGGVDPVTASRARAIADRHRGVGCDQIVTIAHDATADAALIFRNPDGSTAGACGNATRCIADRLMRERGSDAVTLRTAFGLLRAWRSDADRVTVNMGTPLFDWQAIPLAEAMPTEELPIEGGPAAVSMGNPHCVFFVPDAEAVPLDRFGPEIEHHPLFPERTNVEVVQVIDRHTLRARVWERGAGITLACGSGACALTAAAVRRGIVERRVRVLLDGGALEMHWPEGGGVEMTGPVAYAFAGVLDLAALEVE